jgi:hypothetical protein
MDEDTAVPKFVVPDPFVIFALPRSRTAWLASWLGYAGKFRVAHDITIRCELPEDFFSALGQCHGTVETGAVIGWKLIRQRLPNARFVVVKRPMAEVRASLGAFGIDWAEDELAERDAMLDVLSATTGVETIDYDDLTIPQCCQWLWGFCHGQAVPFDTAWWELMAQTNVQVDMAARIEQLRVNADRLAAFRRDVIALQTKVSSPCPPGLN